jgi:hypothetical protein
MNSKKLYYILLGCGALLILCLVGGAYKANKMLLAHSYQLKSSRLETDVLSNQETELLAAKNDISKYQSLYNIAESIVPQDKDQAQTVREIVNLAATNGITLSSVTFPSSSLGVAANGSSATVVAPNDPSNALSQLTPVSSIPGVYELPITVISDATVPIPYGSFINFLSALEQNRRTALVSTITLQPTNGNAQYVSFTLVLNEYVKP